jgi:uncharacterized protein (TIGR03437 family)
VRIRILALLWISAAVFGAAPTITVGVAQPGVAVSPHLYGIFLEEINHAVDGGIYAELVCNRAFNEDGNLTHWDAVGAAALSIDSAEHYGRLSRSLRMQLPGAGQAGVSNGGFWGMKLTNGVTYTATVWAKAAAGFAGPLNLTLKSTGGTVLAETSIATLSRDWRKYVRLLTVSNLQGDTTDNTLVITSAAPGPVWLQLVSLLPPTWKGRANGLRTDLAEALAALRPATLRFPGGSFVQGWDLALSPWRWKDTVGALTDRPGIPGLWGYFSSNGMGLDEYLRMAEDLGAEPILCVYSGKDTGTDVVSQANFGSVVQDALDAIEYANGDPGTTTWGAARASNGHYPPYHLRYVEFGNEDGLSDPLNTYTAYRLPMFLQAVRARYPDIKVVSSRGSLPAGIAADLLDDHFYQPTSAILEQSRMYDFRSRSGPQVLVGEYAALDFGNSAEPQRNNNLGGAIGEAGFMTGLERNGDLIWSALYAPLLVNDNNRTWNPDLIWFNAGQVVLTPNYYVQKLFSNQIGDVTLPVTLADAAGLYVSATLGSSSRTVYLKVVNNNAAPRSATIALDGAAAVTPWGAALTLTSANRTDQNTFAAPNTVTPAAAVVGQVSPRFSYTFPANSVTVLTLNGVAAAAGPRSAFGRIEAESYDSAPSLTVEPCSETGLDLTSISAGSEAIYRSVDFGAGAVAMLARAESAAGATIEIRLDSADGNLAGACAIPQSGDWTTSSCPLSGAGGIHDLYLRFTDSMRLNWIQFLAAPSFTASGVTNAASLRKGLVPGSIAVISGAGLSNASGTVAASGLPPLELGGTSVKINGAAAPIFAVLNANGAEQIYLQVPFEVAGQAAAQVVVSNGNVESAPVAVDVWPAQPGLFTTDGFTAIILHGGTYALVTAADPVHKGESVIVYATGLGAVNNPPASGAASGAAPTLDPVTVEIGGTPAQVSYSGLAPGSVGLYQLEVTVPADAPSGVAPVVVTAAGAVSETVGMAVE